MSSDHSSIGPGKNRVVIVLMGVSGSGKTTIGMRLAKALDWDFFDGDNFHPDANVEKMASGTPLTDEDRWPWLHNLRSLIHRRLEDGAPAVVACSALKEDYRDILLDGNDGASLVYLRGSYDLIRDRMETRDHFFDPDLLSSQFETLEEPEDVLVVDVDAPPDVIVQTIRRRHPALPSPPE